jgi:hypothetical protein
MAFTLADLHHLLGLDPANPLHRGEIQALKRERLAGSGDYDAHALVDELLTAQKRPTAELVRTPWWDVRASHESQRRPLGPADFMWLQRLDRDPAKVSDAEARELFKMRLETELGSSEARLIESMFAPVEALHEGRVDAANRAALAKVAAFPVPAIPSRATEMVRRLIEEADPELRYHETEQRAREVIAAADARRKGQEAPAAPAAPSPGERAAERHAGFAAPAY